MGRSIGSPVRNIWIELAATFLGFLFEILLMSQYPFFNKSYDMSEHLKLETGKPAQKGNLRKQ